MTVYAETKGTAKEELPEIDINEEEIKSEDLAILTMQCFFCSQDKKTIDYKEGDLLRRFVSGQAKNY